jgi:hypothetical protein
MLGRILGVSLLLCIGTSVSVKALLFLDKEGQMGRKVSLSDQESFQTQISRFNTIYVISDVFDLNGAIINISEKVTLHFTEGGGIRHGIKLSNGCEMGGF